jgi:hypothetical protein
VIGRVQVVLEGRVAIKSKDPSPWNQRLGAAGVP